MATLMESYEQQYSNLTAEITAKIGIIPNLTGSKIICSIFFIIDYPILV